MTEVTGIMQVSHVVYANFWTGFRSKALAQLFESIPPDDILKLGTGDIIWIEVEQPQGRVDSLYRVEVRSVEDLGGKVSISYKGPRLEGGTVVEKSAGWHKVNRCKDDAALLALLKRFPLASETGTVTTMSDKSRQYIERGGGHLMLVD